MSEPRVCKMCGRDEDWHNVHRARHPFIPKDSDAVMPLKPKKNQPDKADTKKKKVVLETREWPSDPILRIALVKKGILTQADIIAAEAELREAAASGSVIQVKGRYTGEGSESDLRVGDDGSPSGDLRSTD